MLGAHGLSWDWFERRSATAFLVAGGALTGSTTLKGAILFTDAAPPDVAVVLLGVTGLLAAVTGGLGLYPRLAAARPRAALVGLAGTTLAGAGLVAVLAWALGTRLLTALMGATLPAIPPVAAMALVLVLGLSFLAFGIASVRAARTPRLLGPLVVGFGASWVALLVVGIASGAGGLTWQLLAVYATQPVALLGTGAVLHRASVTQEREVTAGDVAAG